MRIVIISDTHGMGQHALHIPDGDVLIHCGDFCSHGTMLDCIKFFHWFNTFPHKHKIFIAGNHDVWLEQANPSQLKHLIPPELHYLNDSGVELDGVKFWGSPWTPAFMNWAFNAERGEDIKKHWDLIPDNTDVLITHGPPYGFCDLCPDYDNPTRQSHLGCKDLAEKVLKVKPKIHCFGHIHYPYGTTQNEHTTFINASIVDEGYRMVNKPWIFNIWADKSVDQTQIF